MSKRTHPDPEAAARQAKLNEEKQIVAGWNAFFNDLRAFKDYSKSQFEPMLEDSFRMVFVNKTNGNS